MTVGKLLRMQRFRSRLSKYGIIVPIDHGLTYGPIDGLVSTDEVERWIGHRHISGVIAHKGVVERLAARGNLAGRGVMVHVNGMSSLAAQPDMKRALTRVENAMRLGADGISMQINFDGSNDADNIVALGGLVDEASACGLPVLVMLYDKVKASDTTQRLSRLRHLMRICVELGADALKIAAPEQESDLQPLLHGISKDIPVYVAGGAVQSDMEVLRLARTMMECGGAGLCIGRNIFQREDASGLLDSLGKLFVAEASEAERPALSQAVV